MKKAGKSTVNVAAIRRATGLNQTQFWRRVGCTQSGGSRYESGRAMPKPVATLVELLYSLDDEAAAAKLAQLRTPAAE